MLFKVGAQRIETIVANRGFPAAPRPLFDPPLIGSKPDVGDHVAADLGAAATAKMGQTQAELVEQFIPVIPVQAKGGKDQLAVVQTKQDLACCAEKFPRLSCRSVSAQFIDMEGKKGKKIAMFELAVEDERVVIVDERHYRLVPSVEISSEDLMAYGNN